jgi:hypothetical protein
MLEPGQYFIGIGMGRKHVEVLDLGLDRPVLAVNLDFLSTADQGRTARARRPGSRKTGWCGAASGR